MPERFERGPHWIPKEQYRAQKDAKGRTRLQNSGAQLGDKVEVHYRKDGIKIPEPVVGIFVKTSEFGIHIDGQRIKYRNLTSVRVVTKNE